MKRKNGSWIVILNCSVTKQVICENCTEHEAEENPFDHAIDETEISQEDWEVLEVKENK